MKKYLTIVFILILQLIISAQQKKADSTYYLSDTVIVSASRYMEPLYQIPFSVDIISPEILNTFHESLSGNNLFRFIPGMVVNNRYNLSEGDRIIIRGIGSRAQFGVSGIKILLDGIPLTFPDGQSQLNNLDLNSIGKIEIIHGPSSFLYGNSAAGVIYIQSNNVNASELTINPGFSFGSFDFQKFSLNSSERIGNNALLFSIYKMNVKGFRENSAASETAFNIISTQHFNDELKLEGILNYYNAPYLLNPSSLTKTDAEINPAVTREFVKQQGAGKKINQGQVGVTVAYEPDINQKLNATFYGIFRNMLNPIPGRVIKLNRISGGFRSDYSIKFNISDFNIRLLAGCDFEFQNDLRKEYANNGLNNYNSLSNDKIIESVSLGEKLIDQRELVNDYGLFSKIEFLPLESTYVSLGLRYDNYNFKVEDHLNSGGIDKSGSLPMDNLSEMAGVVYRFNTHLETFINYSTAFQTPTTDELGNTPNAQGGFNKDLNPELIKNFEIGVRGNQLPYNIFYKASIYKLIIDRMLIPYQLPGQQTDEVFYRNTGGAVNNGAEFTLNWIPNFSWNISLSYAFMDFKYKNFSESELAGNKIDTFRIGGHYVPGIPKQKIVFGLSNNFPFGLYAGIFFNWSDKYFVNDLNGPTPDLNNNLSDYINNAYFTTDLNFDYTYSFHFGEIEIFLGINNLFNKKYNGSIIPNAAADRYFEPAAPRNWYGGVTIKFH